MGNLIPIAALFQGWLLFGAGFSPPMNQYIPYRNERLEVFRFLMI